MANDQNFLEMSDEDFLNAMPPSSEPEQVDIPEVVPETTKEDKPAEEVTPEVTPEPTVPGPMVETEEEAKPVEQVEPEKKEQPDPETVDLQKEKPKEAEVEKPAEPEDGGEKKPTQEEYESFFRAVTGEFKAAGKVFAVKNAEEARQLMQKGVDYTQKMQALAPHRKMLLTLQHAGLADEEKINHLIELSQGKPEAIQKLLQEKNIDPLTIDTSAPTTYQAGNHFVSDQAVMLQTSLDEMNSSDEGRATLTIIGGWDQASKGEVGKHPGVIQDIHNHRMDGTYDRVANEVHRLQVLGQIGHEVPFIHAYKAVYDQAVSQGLLNPAQQVPAKTTPAAPVPITTRVAAPANPVQNNERAAAAAPTGTTTKPAKTFVNPLAMSDEEFLKNFEAYKSHKMF